MNTSKPEEDNLWVSISDLKWICKCAKKRIWLFTIIGALLLGIYNLTFPIEYSSSATFREKNGQMTAAPTGFASILLGGTRSSHYSEAISTMQSRSLLEELVKRFDLQGSIFKQEAQYPRLANAWNNIRLTVLQLNNKQGLIFKDKQAPLHLTNIKYNGEIPTAFRLFFNDEQTFLLYPTRKAEPIKGTLGHPVTVNDTTFTIVRKTEAPISSQQYIVSINSMTNVINHLSHKIMVEIDREDKTLLKLKYSDPNRHQSAAVLNGLMEIYQDYLKKEQKRITSEQLGYLQQRQGEVRNSLQNMMEEHAAILTADVKNIGFPDVNSAITFFAATQQQHTRELLTIDLELKHLLKVQQEGVLSHAHDPSHEGAGINSIVTRMRSLKQQADSIELGLTEKPSKEVIAKTRQQFAELHRVQHLGEEVQAIIASVEEGHLPNTSLTIYNDPQYKVKTWCEELKSHAGNQHRREACEAQFLTYLSNLKHQFNVHENALHEQLTNQRDTQQEFQGIDLETSKELYLGYSRELNNMEAEGAQKKFIIEQMKDPAFEISSLSAVLTDPVSQKMISTASTLLLSLKDEDNRSTREQERLRNELSVQKGFLAEHLQQIIQLLELRQNLLKEKIEALQTTTLGLIRQELSVLEKHLTDTIVTRVEQLEQQKSVIEQHQTDLKREMLKLPEKWVSEKLINQQMELNARMVEEITKLVESKNTSSSMDLIQSAPVDLAIPPLQPKSPRVLLFMFLGGGLGACLAISLAFGRSVATGFPVTAENLKLTGLHVAGRLLQIDPKKPLADTDLETLRRLCIFLESAPHSYANQARTAGLILEPNGPDYTHALSMLMTKKGTRVLTIPLFFSQPEKEGSKGLLQYLEGKIESPEIVQTEAGDLVTSGGISRFAHELIRSARFEDLINKLQSDYDWILISTHASVSSTETEALCHLTKNVVITITNQTWDDIRTALLITSQNSQKKNTSFIIA